MRFELLHAKLHHARVTSADRNYVGSITIDRQLLDAVGIYPSERVQVADVENGNRFDTYVLEGARGGRIIQVNGAAAHLVNIGDRLIIMAYASVGPAEAEGWEPKVALLDSENGISGWAVNAHVPGPESAGV